MKLLFCEKCTDIIRLIKNETTFCKCGSVGGKYIDNLNAVYFGEMGVPIGFDNYSFYDAICDQPKEGMGVTFTAFVIPKNCPTYKLVLKNEC